MKTKNNREKVIKEFLGLEELTPMEMGVIRGGGDKKKDTVYDPPLPELDNPSGF